MHVTPVTEPSSSDKSNDRSQTTSKPSLGDETLIVYKTSKSGNKLLTNELGKTLPSKKGENNKSVVTQFNGEEVIIGRQSLVPVPGLEPCYVTPVTEPPSSDKNNDRSQTTSKPSLGVETLIVYKPIIPAQRESWQKGEWETPNNQ